MKIIKVTPVPKLFNITWMLGSYCNYDCMYCDREWHDSISTRHDLETLKSAWQNIYQKTKDQKLNYKISFTGGEVTANKNFLPLVEWLRQNYTEIESILLTTNGSATEKYYLQLCEKIESISFSTHSEFMDEQAFFQKVLSVHRVMIPPKKTVHVNIMNETWNRHRISLYESFLKRHNISYSINDIDYSRRTRDHVLTQGKFNLEI